MDKITKEDKLRILDETVEFYTNNPRSMNEGGKRCKYVSDEGLNCAFSRLCTPEQRVLLHANCEGIGVSHTLVRSTIGIPMDDLQFYVQLQVVHDDESNWITDKGEKLTINGIECVRRMKQQIEDGKI